MEVSALKYTGAPSLHGRSPLLRLQSDERLIAAIRRGNHAAFEVLVNRYEQRLLAFCRHLLGSREDAEDVLQEVFAAAFNAILADERAINARPWLYRIARNRSLNHLRRIQAVGVDTMDIHFSDNGASTADKVDHREEFRLLVGDIHELPETQRTALLLREMEALSYEQIAEAMETTVPSVKSLLVRARVALAEAAEARQLTCDQVRLELGEAAEGLRRRPGPLVRRHLRSCDRCAHFRVQLKDTNKALAALLPVGPLVMLKKFVLAHMGHSAGSGAAAGGGAAAATGTFAVGSGTGLLGAGVTAVATKAAAGFAAAVIVTAGAVEVERVATQKSHHHGHRVLAAAPAVAASRHLATVKSTAAVKPAKVAAATKDVKGQKGNHVHKSGTAASKPALLASTSVPHRLTGSRHSAAPVHRVVPPPPPGRKQSQTSTTVLPTSSTSRSGSHEVGTTTTVAAGKH